MNKIICLLLSLACAPVTGWCAVGDKFDASVTYTNASGSEAAVAMYFQVTAENGANSSENAVQVIMRAGQKPTLGNEISAQTLTIPSTVARTADDGTVYTYQVTAIGDQAFQSPGSTSIGTLLLPATLSTIDGNAFTYMNVAAYQVAEGNAHFSADADGVLYNADKTTLVRFPRNNKEKTAFGIPSTVTAVADYAFYSCAWMKELTMESSVLTIGCCSFESCGNLTSITLSDQLTAINEYAFCGCSSLVSVVLPETLTSLGQDAFRNCSKLESVNIPNSITAIYSETFRECSSLKSINFPAGLRLIGGYAFYNARSLTEIHLPPAVTLEHGAFAYCSGLTSVVLPEHTTIKDIKDSGMQFSNCTNLHTVYALMLNPEKAGDKIFASCAADFKLCVPLGMELRYAQTEGWKTATDIRPILNVSKPTGKTFAYENNIDLDGTIAVDANYQEVTPLDDQKLKVYIATAVTDQATRRMKVTGQQVSGIVPASSADNKAGLIIYGSQDLLYVLKPTDSAATADMTGNLLQGVLSNDLDMGAKTGSRYFFYNGGTFYVSNGGQFSTTATGSSVSTFPSSYKYASGYAYKCYLDCGSPTNAKSFSFVLADDSQTTGIDAIATDGLNGADSGSDDSYYTLDGIRVRNPSLKGIYIHHGKKVIIK